MFPLQELACLYWQVLEIIELLWSIMMHQFWNIWIKCDFIILKQVEVKKWTELGVSLLEILLSPAHDLEKMLAKTWGNASIIPT